jgi:tetratricopeptide (TPR) repeat protein
MPLAFLLLWSAAMVAAAGGNDEAGPADRAFLELEARYSLAGLGVDLDVAVAPGGAVYVGSGSVGRLWRLEHGGLSPFADERLCDQGSRVWPSAVGVDAGGRLWVVDQRSGRVQAIDPMGRSIACRVEARRERDAVLVFQAGPGTPRRRWAPTGSHGCIEAVGPGFPDLYCISLEGDRVVKVHDRRVAAEFRLPGRYPRAVGLALDHALGNVGNDVDAVYVTDAANARLYRLSPALTQPYRLRLYEKSLRSPGRLALANGRLWLIDEGRQELLEFALRRAQTALEHRLLGEEFLSLGLYRQALAELARAGGDGAALSLLQGRALYGLKRYQQAWAAFSQAGRAPRSRAEAGFHAANSLFRLGRYDAALTAYRRAARAPGRFAWPAAFNQAQTLVALGRYQAAGALFDDLERRRPGDPGVRVGAARSALGQGDAAAAIEWLTPLPTAPTGSVPVRESRLVLGLARFAAGSARQALPLLQQAARDGPRYREALTALAQAQHRLGLDRQAAQTRATLAGLSARAAALNDFILEE